MLLLVVARILSLDVGEKRIGIALSDPSGLIAQALKVYHATGPRAKDIAEIRKIIGEFEAARIVVGLPRNLDGSIGPKAQAIIRFAEDIGHSADVPVDMWDERFSTDEAHRIFDMASIKRHKRKGSIDMMAAQIILKGYLDAKGHA